MLLILATTATTAVLLAAGSPPYHHAGAAAGGVASVLDPKTGTYLMSGGSNTEFAIGLPPSAACPGDTQHKGYLLYSYVVPAAMSPASLTYKDGYPAVGVDLVTASGSPWVTAATGVNSGAVIVHDVFQWSRYDHDPADLTPGHTYNVGISCSLDFKTVSYWNTRIRFLASATDPGGFTWVADNPAPASKSGSGGLGLGATVGILAALAIAGSLVALRLRRPRFAR